jgi:hypothetical protein
MYLSKTKKNTFMNTLIDLSYTHNRAKYELESSQARYLGDMYGIYAVYYTTCGVRMRM